VFYMEQNEIFGLVFFGLSAIYLVLSLYGFHCLLSPKKHSDWKKIFNALFVLASLLRMLFFVLTGIDYILGFKIFNPVFFLLGTLPAFLYVSSFLIIPFVYFRVFRGHVEAIDINMPQESSGFLIGINLIMYISLLLLYISDFRDSTTNVQFQFSITTPQENIIIYLDSCIFFLTAFVCIANVVFKKRGQAAEHFDTHSSFSSYRRTSENITLLTRLGIGALACVICFLVRAIFVFVLNKIVFISDTNTPYVQFAYYVVLEVLPLGSVFLVVNLKRHNNAPYSSRSPLLASTY